MKNKNLIKKALNWKPDPTDSYGKDKLLFLEYALKNCLGLKNAKSIKLILKSNIFSRVYSENEFQHNILVPLREVGDFFIGTGNKGIYFIDSAEDAYRTIEFYTTRIRSEQKHLRTLKSLAKKHRLFENFEGELPKKLNRNVYFDESGTPSMSDIENDPYFIVTAVIIDETRPIYAIEKKLNYVRNLLGKPNNYEFKANKLRGNRKHYKILLREITTLDIEFASVCFDKKLLTSKGFQYPKSFYKYAFKFLLDNVLNYCGSVNLYFDVYSNKGSSFEKEFLSYIKKASLGFPINKVDQTDMLSSGDHPLIQIADILSGVVREVAFGKDDLLNIFDDKMIEMTFFPNIKGNGA